LALGGIVINSINLIKNVGTFSYFSPATKLKIEKNTIIFAENGYGKSTLATIIKSLQFDDPKKIISRLTINPSISDHEQKIVIISEIGNIIFESGKWNLSKSEERKSFLVFDQQYVFDNLFVLKVESEHKQNIHRIVIGEKGLELSQKLIEIKSAEKDAKRELDILAKELKKKIANTGRNDYLEIEPKEAEITKTKISNVENTLQKLKENNRLQVLATFDKNKPIDFSIAEIIRLLTINPQEINENAKDIIENHIKTNHKTSTSSESFLRIGTEIMTDVCPFCGEPSASTNPLFGAYSEYYNQDYQRLRESITSFTKDFSSQIIISQLHKNQSVSDKNFNRMEQLTSITSIHSVGSYPFIDYENEIALAEKFSQDVVSALTKKANNLSDPIDTHFLDVFSTHLVELNQIISIQESFFESISNEISSILKESTHISEQQLREELEKLIALQHRFDIDEEEWCQGFISKRDALDKLLDEKSKISSELDNYSKNIFESYQKGMNEVLERLGVDFRISQFKEQVDDRANQPFAEFCIEINNVEIPLKELAESPCFQNTLSEGEKNTLSFAFFITELSMMENIETKIVIFDDPLSSMDDNRRIITSKILQEISEKVKQIIILTHKKDFLHLLCDKLSAPRVLTIRKDKMNGSVLIDFDIEHERKPDYQKNIEKLNRYLNEDFCEVCEIQESIRPCLENAITHKFFAYLHGAVTLGRMIDELEKQGLLDSSLISELRDLNEISSAAHHNVSTTDPIKSLNRSEILPYVKKTLPVLLRI
jgi:wobble nucleotide-excising tRNase